VKKILIITLRNFSPPHGGDKIRIFKIAKLLSKKNIVDVIYLSDEDNFKKESFVNKYFVFKTNLFQKYLYSFFQFFKLKPLQTGFFYSKKMKKKIDQIKSNYDVIICHLSRSSIYLPESFDGNKILEMTDIISKNYLQRSENGSFLNILKYLYLLESKFLARFEQEIINKFNSVVLVSKEKNFFSKEKLKKVKIIPNGINKVSKKFNFNNNNKYIIFYGNINSHINKNACLNFAKTILPILNKLSEIKLRIVGEINTNLKKNFQIWKM